MKSAIKKSQPIPELDSLKRGCYVYPFDEMDKGDSFVLPLTEYNRVASAAYCYGKRHKIKFTVRRMGKKNQVGVWRVK